MGLAATSKPSAGSLTVRIHGAEVPLRSCSGLGNATAAAVAACCCEHRCIFATHEVPGCSCDVPLMWPALGDEGISRLTRQACSATFRSRPYAFSPMLSTKATTRQGRALTICSNDEVEEGHEPHLRGWRVGLHAKHSIPAFPKLRSLRVAHFVAR